MEPDDLFENTDCLDDLFRSNGISKWTWSHNRNNRTLKLTNIGYRLDFELYYSYCLGKTSGLSSSDRAVLDQALYIARAARDFSDASVEREMFIHDYLCDTVTYQKKKAEYAHETIYLENAEGALIYGLAECDGYSDAFFLTCNLADIPASYVRGESESG